MIFDHYYHTNYKSIGSSTDCYTKVSIEIPGRGAFCTIVNHETGGVQCQCYVYSKRPRKSSYFYGKGTIGMFKDLDSLVESWGSLSEIQAKSMETCIMYLKKAVRKYIDEDESLYGIEEADAKNHVDKLVETFTEKISALKNGDVEASNSGTEMKWEVIDTYSLSREDMGRLVKEINDNGNPEDGTPFNGKLYSIQSDMNGVARVMVLKSAPVTSQNVFIQEKPVAPVRIRKRVQKAMMIDCGDLTEFINGCYYKIVSNAHMDGMDFVNIQNDNGESRCILKNRVKIVDVFDEAPLEEVAQ